MVDGDQTAAAAPVGGKKEEDGGGEAAGGETETKRPLEQKSSSALSALSRTLPPLCSNLTIWFTPVGPPPASVRAVIKCH